MNNALTSNTPRASRGASRGGLAVNGSDGDWRNVSDRQDEAYIQARRNNMNMNQNYQNSGNATWSLYGQAGGLDGTGGQMMNQGLSGQNTSLGTAKSQGIVNPEEYMGQATIDTGLSYDKARGTAERQLSRMGVNPNSGRFAGMEQKWALAKAAAEAGAKTKARATARDENFNRLMSLANSYQNMTSQGLQSKGMAQRGYSDASSQFRALGNTYGETAQGQGEMAFTQTPEVDAMDNQRGLGAQEPVPLDRGITSRENLPAPKKGMMWAKDPETGRNVQVRDNGENELMGQRSAQAVKGGMTQKKVNEPQKQPMTLAKPPKGMKWENNPNTGRPRLVKDEQSQALNVIENTIPGGSEDIIWNDVNGTDVSDPNEISMEDWNNIDVSSII